MAHHRVQQSQQQTNTFSVGLSAEVNHDGEPLEAAEAAFSHHGHHHGLHSLYTAHNGENLVKMSGSNFHICKSLKVENLVKLLRY